MNGHSRFSGSGFRASLISGLFVLLTAALLAVAAGPLRYGFPVLAFIFAYLVYRQSKPFYAGFIVWLWMLAPLVRRLVEYRAGGSAALIISSPFLACAVPLLFGLASLGEMLTPEGYPVLFAAIGIAYGLGVGVLLHNRIPAILTDLAFWVAPLLFAFFLIRFRSQISEIRASLEKAFIWGTLVIGAYGLYQYLVLGPWDALWIETSNVISIGLPEPQQMRVFSTMNSPQSLAGFLAAGIFIAMRSRSKIKWLAIPFASLSLLLTQARTGWVGFVAGFIYLIFHLPARQRLQIAIAGALSVILVVASLQGDQKDILTARLQTLTAPNDDGSFSLRMEGFTAMFPEIASFPFGAGIGLDDTAANPNISTGGEGLGVGDSGILAMVFGLGIPGSVMYLIGIGSAIGAGFRRRSASDATNLFAFRAMIIAAVVTSFAIDSARAPGGFVTWMALALCATLDPVELANEPEPASREIPVARLAYGKARRSAALGPPLP